MELRHILIERQIILQYEAEPQHQIPYVFQEKKMTVVSKYLLFFRILRTQCSCPIHVTQYFVSSLLYLQYVHSYLI